MQPVECPFEQDLLDAIAADRWPSRCGDRLQHHVAGCSTCADLAVIAPVMKGAVTELWDAARIPSSGTVWWRAQTRARREAAREAARPVTVAHAFGFGAVLVALAALIWVTAPWLSGVAEKLPGLPPLDFSVVRWFDLAGPLDAFERWRWVIAAAIGWLVLASLAVYFALLED